MKIFTDHNLFILGAGFSAEANMPLMNTYMNEIKKAFNWYDENSKHRSSIETILKFRKLATSSAYRINLNLDNIEDLFSLAATEGSSSIDLLKTGLCSTLEYCKKSRIQNLSFRVNAKEKIPYLNINESVRTDSGSYKNFEIDKYDFVASKICSFAKEKKDKDEVNSVISFNYDTVLEDSLDSICQKYTYCLNNSIDNLKELEALPIAKLHGSMNWTMINDKISIKPFQDILDENKEPYIIPPIWTKSSNGITQNLWENALKLISTATRIIIVGFSMPKTDLFFRYLLASGLKDNLSLEKIFIVNPNVDQIIDDVHEIFAKNETRKRIETFNISTTNAFRDYKFKMAINRLEEKSILSFL